LNKEVYVKEFRFINTQSLKEFKDLPDDVRTEFADALNAMAGDQGDLTPDEYRTGQGVAYKLLKGSGMRGVTQLSINGSPAYRVVYCAKFGNRLYVLHSWTKTAVGSDKKALNTLAGRWKELLSELRTAGLIK